MPPELVLDAIGLTRSYAPELDERPALDHVSLEVAKGEIVAIIGPSGSGKSTLLHLLGGLDAPDAGNVRILGTDWQALRGDARARFIRRTCGFVMQGLALLPQATAAENVEVPMVLDGVAPSDRQRRVAEALDRVGLSEFADRLTDQLSGGEQQRVSIARAIVNDPVLILADEPTGSLDSVVAERVTQLLLAAASERGAAVVLVTHDPVVAGHAHRVVALHSGRIDTTARATTPVTARTLEPPVQ